MIDDRYNAIGQLQDRALADRLQSTSLRYNERGWLKSSGSAQFSYELKYQDGAQPQFNGNISAQEWSVASVGSNTFNYKYDNLNRLTSGVATGMSEVLTYDFNGNIKTLKRDAVAVKTYTYIGNRLDSIRTLGVRYVYDGNGNVIKDGRTGLAITYNSLNLPSKVGTVSYIYDASGRKLRKTGDQVTDYVDGIQYTSGAIDVIQTEVGIARRSGTAYSYEYNLTDHLGNVRYTFNKNSSTGAITRVQSDDYYPFGLRKSTGSPVSLNNKYLYNGKELQEEFGQYDYGARFYDPVVGRWNVVDPLAEGTDHLSPYNYAMNNPILMIDPDGLSADTSKITTTINLLGVEITSTRVKVLPSVEGFWSRLWYSNINGGRDAQYNGYTVVADADGWAFNTRKPIALAAPDIGMKGGFNTVYKGVKSGLPYVGKAFNVFKRYSKAERALMKIEPVLNGIDDPKLLRAVEQKVLEYSKSKGGVANIRNAFDPKRSDYAEYGVKAVQWMENNVPHWKELF